jgi:N-acyl homoserine lactone hydrolase
MVTIDVLVEGSTIWSKQGIMGFCSVLLIQGEKNTLVDVGHVGRRNVLLDALDQRGLTPADIDQSVMTHAHWDHAQNFDLFDHAPVLIHEAERRYAKKPHKNDWATPQWTGAMIEWQSRIQEVEEGHEIEAGVSLIHTPGHSPGCVSVLCETDDGIAAITGDVLHFSKVALTRRNPLVFWSEEDATRSIDRILDVADVIYPGHDRPFRLVGGGDQVEYLRPLELELGGVDPDDPGFRFSTTLRTPWVMPGIEEQRLPD